MDFMVYRAHRMFINGAQKVARRFTEGLWFSDDL